MRFTDALDRDAAADAGRYKVKVWGLKRTASYGSEHYDEHEVKVEGVEVSADGKSVTLRIPELAPTWGMEILSRLKGEDGEEVERVIHNTVHKMAP